MLSRLATELKDIFAKIGHRHDSDYEPKNTNIQTHVSSTSNPHGTTASQVGLGNVTNNKQIKAAASSTVGKIPIWSNTTGDLLGDGYAVETTLTTNSGNIPTSSAVSTAINNAIDTKVSNSIPTALSELSKDINFDERYYTEIEIDAKIGDIETLLGAI